MRVGGVIAALLTCLPLHYLWTLAGRRSPWPRRFLAAVARIIGMRAEIVGKPLPHHVLFLANHLSWLDILLIAGASGAAFVSKDDVARWPIIGWLARMNRTIFVARTQRSAVRGQADTLRQALGEGKPVALFPEGTTGGGAEILPFRPSLLASLYPPLQGVSVQPVAIDYGPATRDIAWVGDEPAKDNALRVLRRKGSTRVRILFLESIDPSSHGDRKALAEAARADIIRALSSSASRANAL